MQDIRFAFRTLWKSRGFAFIAVIALALGIGANTAIFTVVNSVLLRPAPYPESERIMFVERAFRDGRSEAVAIPKADHWRRNTRAFEAMAQTDLRGSGVNLAGDEAERLTGVRVSQEYFRVIGVFPALGRSFNAQDDTPNAPKTAVLSHSLWKRRFGGDPGILGRPITLNNEPVTVIGVMPADFKPYPESEIWLPLQAVVDPSDRANYLHCLARIRKGFTREQALADIVSVTRSFGRQHPDLMFPNETATLASLHEKLVGDVRPALLVLMAAVAAVLLIACANVANLLLARAAGREREVAIRMSLGAGRVRLIRQLLTESTLLSLAGGALGVILGYWGVRLLEAIAPTRVPLVEVTMDLRVLAFTLAVSLATGVLFGLVPALHASRPNLTSSLKEGSARSGGTARKNRTRSLLVAGEVAVALVVVICAALLTQTFVRLRSVNPGFDPRNVLTFQMSIAGKRFETAANVDAFTRRAVERLESIPGVRSAGTTLMLPLEGGSDLPFTKEDGKDTERHNAQWRPVSAHSFDALGYKVKRGRGFNLNDTVNSSPVVVINEAIARRYYAGIDPVGQRLTIGKGLGVPLEDKPRQIVGVMADVKETGLDSATPATLYIPAAQASDHVTALLNRVLPATWAVRTNGDPSKFVSAVRAEMRSLERENPIANIRTMEQVVSEATSRQSFNMLLLGTFALLAMLLAAVGIYGVMAYSVTQRTHELGIRMALGAGRAQVLRMVVGQGMMLAGAGIAAGLAGAYLSSRLIGRLLFGVAATNPGTYTSMAAVIALIALIASLVPAWRATRISPITALRCE